MKTASFRPQTFGYEYASNPGALGGIFGGTGCRFGGISSTPQIDAARHWCASGFKHFNSR